MNIPCPKCGFESPEGAEECPKCGIVFAHWHATDSGRPSPAAAARQRPLPRGEVADLKVAGIGLAIAVVVTAIPFTRFIFHPIIILVHELGHAVAGWLFGYPSIPSFDFLYGGGITPHGEFQIAIVLAVVAGFGYLGYIFRQNPRALALIGAVFVVWLLFATAEWRRLLVVEAAGHLSECIFAGTFLYMALAGVGWRMPEIERPLGAFLAFFIEINMIRFCLDLMHDQDFLEVYKQGKGGMLMHDVDSVSADLIIHTPWHPSIQSLAFLLLLFSFVTMAIAVLLWWRRDQVERVLQVILT